MERTFLVPSDPAEFKQRLPLPDGGGYIFVYNGSSEIITKSKFKQAFANFAKECRVVDFLVWDRSDKDQPATLWSVRGGIGHIAGTDVDSWPEHLVETAQRMKQFLK